MSFRENKISDAIEGVFDLIVIGGGIHGASVARSAALRGYRVLLLERKDFGYGSSSRSSKMLHGGVRYLETMDFRLVKEALHEREILTRNARHLTQPQEFLFPVLPGMTRPAWQVRIGLRLYDFFAARERKGDEESAFRKHRVVSKGSEQSQQLRDLGLTFSGLFAYYDGQMDDARITVETVVDAAENGALTLNHAPVGHILRASSLLAPGQGPAGKNVNWVIKWACSISGEKYESRASFLVNASGPWLPEVHENLRERFRTDWNSNHPQPVFSRGVHLLFDVPWSTSGLILPTGTKGRYYFVWPYYSIFSGKTLVGTTDRQVDRNERDPQATESEIEELLGFLQRDLPEAGLDRSTLYQTFCGMRILAGGKNSAQSGKSEVSKISREHFWIEDPHGVALLGGKYTNARSTAEQAVERVDEYFGKRKPKDKELLTEFRPLPGTRDWSTARRSTLTRELSEHLRSRAHECEGSARETTSEFPSQQSFDRQAEISVARFGSRAERLLEKQYDVEKPFRGSGAYAIVPEVRMAILDEQAMTVEDILRRRLGVTLLPGGGESLLRAVENELVLTGKRKRAEVEEEVLTYRRRWLSDPSN